ncbi:hypothetical protein Tcan_09381 [Toxocara canis]|uniref:Uncharacterized protein n=2 Tax=Toxocara canis TaxID=6265 RepID=A0A0B2UTD1_TOXCA|nr:hypothetical protein Tcan_09381 [Toxocara canis]VDM36583.1 unnamed protein product [Toxocara canis]
MGRRLVWNDDTGPRNSMEWAPPLRIISVVTLFASTLDLMADFLICNRISEFIGNFESDVARIAAYGYFFFTGVSVFVYILEMTDVCLSLKNDYENVFFARLAKSLVLAAEEVPLPALLYVMYTHEPRSSIANPAYLASWIKLISLSWGIVKFTKLRFFWCCLPLNPKHDTRENVRRCFYFTLYRATMLFINTCHVIAIIIVIINIVESGKGGRQILRNRSPK